MDAAEKQRFAALARAVAERRDYSRPFPSCSDYFAPRLKSLVLTTPENDRQARPKSWRRKS